LAALFAVARRKLGMNWRILQDPWFVLSLAGVAFAVLLCYHGFGLRVRALMASRPDLRAGVAGILAAGSVGLAVNDSGVVVAGYVACALVALLVCAVLEDVRPEAAAGTGRSRGVQRPEGRIDKAGAPRGQAPFVAG
jgi:hypothetical protein